MFHSYKKVVPSLKIVGEEMRKVSIVIIVVIVVFPLRFPTKKNSAPRPCKYLSHRWLISVML